jgi:putative tryptophan/tyrosine transport system substrate-binding protein
MTFCIGRREFITLLGGAAAAWPLAARAQQPERVRRIGVLSILAESDVDWRASIKAFERGLKELGWTEGRNIQINYRGAAGNVERLSTFAKELAGMAPEVLLATNTPALAVLQRMTDSVPIVFVQVSDPVGDGFVATLARPGGRITGLTNFEPTMGGKWLEILKEIAPEVARVALPFNPQTSPGGGSFYSRQIEAAAATFAMQPIPMPLRNATEIEPAIIEFARHSNSGLVIVSDSFIVAHRELVMGLAARHRLPAIYPFRYFAKEGGLVSYGVDRDDSYRRVAAYVDRILRGAKPADLPVEAPTKFELVINLKTAKALGLTVPPVLIARADEVIE